MKFRKAMPLWGKVLLVAVLEAALLGGASVWFLRRLLAQDFGSILLGSSRERIVNVSRQISGDLSSTAPSGRDAVLRRYAKQHGVALYLFYNSGRQVAGPAVSLPASVLRRVEEGPRGTPGTGRVPMGGATQVPPFLTTAEPGYWVGVRMPIRTPGVPFVELGTLLISSRSLITNSFLFDPKPWLALLTGVLAITLICWLPLIGGLTRSIHKLSRVTAQIAAGRLEVKAGFRRSDELGELAESIHRMAKQLAEHVHGQKRFLRDAAHELRSPLARMQAALGILERQTGPESERVLQDLREEIELMSTLTGDLLTLARSEYIPVTPNRLTAVDLGQTTLRAVSTENARGAADVRVEVEPGLHVTADAESLFRGISNLVRNAIRYAGDAGPITVAAKTGGASVCLTIADHGPGIPAEAVDKIFTPFFRLDVSRDRKTGGAGLGMAIARACIENCKGTIRCRNADPGLEVTIVLASAGSAAAAQTVSGN